MTITLSIISPAEGSFQAVLTREGSTVSWPLSDTFPTEDAVMTALASWLYAGQWQTSEWDASKVAPEGSGT